MCYHSCHSTVVIRKIKIKSFDPDLHVIEPGARRFGLGLNDSDPITRISEIQEQYKSTSQILDELKDKFIKTIEENWDQEKYGIREGKKYPDHITSDIYTLLAQEPSIDKKLHFELKLNASDDRGINVVRKEIKTYAIVENIPGMFDFVLYLIIFPRSTQDKISIFTNKEKEARSRIEYVKIIVSDYRISSSESKDIKYIVNTMLNDEFTTAYSSKYNLSTGGTEHAQSASMAVVGTFKIALDMTSDSSNLMNIGDHSFTTILKTSFQALNDTRNIIVEN
ncbi:hypothetical protein Glove_267g17 [Diversispora epigaea]|uniref:Uncharacterized protein n=1 Tax=Diversispora epigaea TaxID=1348612 RepID=A0A397I954_9GLOM|nr:hypothetical protein Glove_267g17 [Diversispora epigaea]